MIDTAQATTASQWRVQSTTWSEKRGEAFVIAKKATPKDKTVLVAKVFGLIDGDPSASRDRLAALVAAAPVLRDVLQQTIDCGTLPADVEQAARDALAEAQGQ
jgi:hypothetical protein